MSPTGYPVASEFEAMVELVIHERRIALPAQRLVWYAHWFGIGISPTTAKKLLRNMVKSGKLTVIKDGRYRYYKLRVNR
jgi:hypothetical protein